LLDPASFCRGHPTGDTRGFANHGTSELSRLGGPALHAAALFALVERNGPRQTRIELSNEADTAAVFNDPITLSIIGKISGVGRWITQTDYTISARSRISA
jgi:hypothetical protein